MLLYLSNVFAGVMELADVVDSKSTGGNTVPVRIRPPALVLLAQTVEYKRKDRN